MGVVVARVQVLAEAVFHKIAAGEVIERPLSAVKELVENAIDAGADNIAVELRAGGKELIKVEDNGSGFAAGDIEIAFQSHTTSKLTELEDLDHLQTLGFRGEALPSILAVADIELETSDNDESRGWYCRFSGGRLQEKKQSACRRGSTVTVKHLFTNFPVRLKFLKSDQGELRPITAFLEVTALARPAVVFNLQHNGRTVFAYSATATLRERIYQIFGKEFLDGLRAVDFCAGEYQVNGFISGVQTGLSGKERQFFMVNGRPVKEKTLMAAFNNSYLPYLEKSRYPAGVLNFSIPPRHIDVNIHPMKLEIRFLDGNRVYQFVKNAVDSTLGRPLLPLHDAEAKLPPAFAIDRRSSEQSFPARESAEWFTSDVLIQADDFRVLGQYQNSYIVIEKKGELLIIDQHNARERVLFERLKTGYQAGSVTSAGVLFPLLLELSPAEQMALDEKKLGYFKKTGFDIRMLSGSTIEIKAYPSFLTEANLKETVLAALRESEKELLPEDQLLAAIACHDAVKVNQRLQSEQQRTLVKDLFACENPYFCPHRRPIIVTLTLTDIEKQLKRR